MCRTPKCNNTAKYIIVTFRGRRAQLIVYSTICGLVSGHLLVFWGVKKLKYILVNKINESLCALCYLICVCAFCVLSYLDGTGSCTEIPTTHKIQIHVHCGK